MTNGLNCAVTSHVRPEIAGKNFHMIQINKSGMVTTLTTVPNTIVEATRVGCESYRCARTALMTAGGMMACNSKMFRFRPVTGQERFIRVTLGDRRIQGVTCSRS